MFRKVRFYTFLVVAFLIALMGFFWFQSSADAQRKLSALRERGLPATAPEVNDFYVIPEGESDATAQWVAAIDAMSDLKADTAKTSLPLIGRSPDPIPLPGDPWEQLEEAETFVKSHQHVLDLAHSAAAVGGVARYPVDFTPHIATLLPYAQDARLLSRFIEFDSWIALHRGNSARAYANVRSMLALSKSLKAEPCLISQLVRQATFSNACRSACDFASRCDWTDEQLQQLQLDISDADFLSELQRACHGDRANLVSAIGDVGLGPLTSTNVSLAIDLFEKCIASMDSGWQEALTTGEEVTQMILSAKEKESGFRTHIGVFLLFPHFKEAVLTAARNEVKRKCAILILAARRFEKSTGTKPLTLEQLRHLVPGTFEELVIDPLNDQPLIIRHVGSEVVIYSVGQDQIDDNGSTKPVNDESQPKDIGYRL